MNKEITKDSCIERLDVYDIRYYYNLKNEDISCKYMGKSFHLKIENGQVIMKKSNETLIFDTFLAYEFELQTITGTLSF